MNIKRIYAVIIRYVFNFRHSLDRISDSFYWPVIDLLIWGLTSKFFSPQSIVEYSGKTSSQHTSVFLIILSGLLFWLIVWRIQYEVSVNLLLEFWDKNLINLFVSPLRFSEWIVSVVIVGILKSAMSFLFAMGMAYLIYRTHILFYGFAFIPIILLLFLTGWWVGFFISGIILRYGTKVATFAWSAISVLAPFSAIYYPISILPKWAQTISAFVPTSYVFEGAREIMKTGIFPVRMFSISFALSVLYLILSLIFLKRSYDKILEKKGLVKVY